jgi:beta-lysine 5,6-aminomutase beta subunit
MSEQASAYRPGADSADPGERRIIRPYGDTTGDGMVQMSFTLPMAHDKRAEGAALQLAQKMGMEPAMVVHAKAMGPHFTFFVVYGSVHHLVDLAKVRVVEREYPLLSAKEVNAAIKRRLRRKLVVLGACIGTDAHTVGIDAILNIKGFAGEKGLEYYREIRVVNLGAQVLVPDLVARARSERADAVLVSQVVTQKDAHLRNTAEMSAAFREAYPADTRPLLVVGGPTLRRVDGGDLGVDRIFGRGTTPGEVAELPGARAAAHATVGARAYGPVGARATRECPGMTDDPRMGLVVTHRRYVPYSHAHYGGDLVDGAYVLGLFGDVATEMCIRTSTGTRVCSPRTRMVQFRAPGAGRRRGRGDGTGGAAGGGAQPRAGPRGRASSAGRSRDRTASAAEVLDRRVVAVTARGTVVVPAGLSRARPTRGVDAAPTARMLRGVSEPTRRAISEFSRVRGVSERWAVTCTNTQRCRSEPG